MPRMPGWMPDLVRQLNWGCTNSPLLAEREDNEELLKAGKEICFELWPFIKMLPPNIACVLNVLPPEMQAARSLLQQLVDEEHYYQDLYLEMCRLGGFSKEELESAKAHEATEQLCSLLTHYCNQDYTQGLLAIVAAELAATAFARASLPLFERYFAANTDSYKEKDVDRGLAWLRIHTESQPKHAMWMRTMLTELGGEIQGTAMPEPVSKMVEAVYRFWRITEKPRAKSRPSTAEATSTGKVQ